MNSSNVTIKSNVYIRNGKLKSDKDFLDKLIGEKKLEECIENLHLDMTQLNLFQRKLRMNNIKRCQNNEQNNYAWGIVKKGASLREECHCDKLDCEYFKTMCRYGISEEEIEQIKRTYQYNEIIAGTKRIEGTENVIENESVEIEPEEHVDVEGDEAAALLDNAYDNAEAYGSTGYSVVAQSEIISAPVDGKILVNAGPGTGKTWCLVERLKYLLSKGVFAEEILVLCFSRAATAEIKERLRQQLKIEGVDWSIEHVDVRTFDSFATWMFYQIGKGDDLKGKDYDQRIEMAIDVLKERPNILDIKHLIVDEIQDLVGPRARLVETMLENSDVGFTLLGDSCQAIYDYQVKDKINEPDSMTFYNWLDEYFGNSLKKFALEGNRRQNKDMAIFTDSLRRHILAKDVAGWFQIMYSFKDRLDKKCCLGPPHKLQESDIYDKKKIAFLCRSNGEALKLSTYFRDNGIEHVVQRLAAHTPLQGWLGTIFGEMKRDVIDYEEFKALHESMLDIDDEILIRRRWDGLKTVEGQDGSVLRIKNFMRNFQTTNTGIDVFYNIPSSDIVISTIHRAKGREYDNVALLDRDLDKIQDINDPDEMNVFYVAFTRARQNVWLVKFDKKRISHSDFEGRRRWYQLGSGSMGKHVALVEVGQDGDIDVYSFVSNALHGGDKGALDNQKYIRENVNIGDEVVLNKRIVNNAFVKVKYDILHNGKCIGMMSDEFTISIFQTIGCVQRRSDIKAEDCPAQISRIFVEAVSTCVDANASVHDIAEIYKSSCVWNGVVLCGFGRVL